MGYHHVDPAELEQWDDRPADVRSLSAAAGYPTGDSKLGVRQYRLTPGEQAGLKYHYHDEQVECFYVLSGTLHVETPDKEYVIKTGQALFVDPGSPQRAYNPTSAKEEVTLLAIGAPSVDDVHQYNREEA